ncbi:MAG: DUF805 domain-containing protein [Firmicutes bacterium]|nr:DUF805 domain-containing protein [Bacillota bacterium]
MPLVNYFVRVVKDNYFNFNGRDTRKQYWMFVLANVIISFVLSFVAGLISSDLARVISSIYSLAILCPSLGAAARRLHDTGKSGWLQLIAFIPLVGAIVLIVFLAQPGQSGDNVYGEEPYDEFEGSSV